MALFSSVMLVRLPRCLRSCPLLRRTRHKVAFGHDARTILAVGEPFSSSGVAYILQPSAYPARSATGNRSRPSMRIVGLPGKRRRWASSSVLTATSSTPASMPCSASTPRKVFSASRYVGHPSKCRISIFIVAPPRSSETIHTADRTLRTLQGYSTPAPKRCTIGDDARPPLDSPPRSDPSLLPRPPRGRGPLRADLAYACPSGRRGPCAASGLVLLFPNDAREEEE